MTVSNGELANQNTFNTSFCSRENDTNTVGKFDLQNAAAVSGPDLINLQRIINSIASAMGLSTSEVYNFLITWAADYVGAPNDNIEARINALVALFNGTTGHAHTGVNGDAAPVSITDVLGINQFRSAYQTFALVAASGLTVDVSADLTGKIAGGTSTQAGVVTTAPSNRVYVMDTATETFVEDAGGQRVYGRLTYAPVNWTLSFYTNEAGVETAHNLTSTDITLFYLEVFTLATLPTISPSPSDFGSLDITSDVADATPSVPGKVTIAAQAFGGAKTFNDALELLSQFFGSTATNAALTGSSQTLATPVKLITRLTNASLVSISAITAPTKAQFIFLRNVTGNDITLINSDSGANSILSGTGSDFTLADKASCLLFYDLTSARWTLIGGGGGGGALGYQEVLAGTVDGVNDTFGPLSFTPSDDNSIAVYVNGIFILNSNYTVVAGPNIVFNVGSIPEPGQSVEAFYITTGTPAPAPAPTGTWVVDYHTVTAGEETAKSFALSGTPAAPSGVLVDIISNGPQIYSVDFTISGSNFNWTGLGLDGFLNENDIVRIAFIT